MLLTPAQKRKNIGSLLGRDLPKAWIVPFSENGTIHASRFQALSLRKQWFSTTGKKATGSLQIINQSSNHILIPEQTVWWDDHGNSYKLTEPGFVKPNTTSFFSIEALEFGNRNYHGLAQVSNWPAAENADVDFAQIDAIHSQTEMSAGEVDDGEDHAICFALDTVIIVKGGAYVGEKALVVHQQQSLAWRFHAGESLAGFRVMTENMSGYVYHQINIRPILLFRQEQRIELKAGTVSIRFTGVEPEEDQ